MLFLLSCHFSSRNTLSLLLPHREPLVVAQPAQVNFKVQEAAILLDGHDFGHVEMSVIQQLKLAPEVEVNEPLRRAMWRDNARVDACIAYGLLDFNPFLVLSNLGTAQGDRQ